MTLTLRGTNLNVRAISRTRLVVLSEKQNSEEKRKWEQTFNIVKP